jgi:transcriptional regulator with XRE-family HTH domain
MNTQRAGNYLRTQRKRSGMSQREVALLIGYEDDGQISRHERSQTIPSLVTALAYEVIFKESISALFPGIHEHVEGVIEKKLAELEENLQSQSGKGRAAKVVAQKLIWLKERKRL